MAFLTVLKRKNNKTLHDFIEDAQYLFYIEFLIMYIYKITNNINKKIYIGKHASKRKCYWGSGKLIKLAIKKYGKENFIKEIIENCDNEQQLSIREIFWIEYYGSRNRLIGYNITEGGDGNSTICNGFWTDLSILRRGHQYQ